MLRFIRTHGYHPDFVRLTDLLDEELHGRYGDLQCKYDGFNRIYDIDTVVIAYRDEQAVGCGCFKDHDTETVEIKRMFVLPEHRNQGISRQILTKLEEWAKELGKGKFILETGPDQPEAVALYTKCGYWRIENFGQYAGDDHSICMYKG
jgi:GNAT superfamily N-acetyltransferase